MPFLFRLSQTVQRNNKLMNEAKSTVITVLAVDIRRNDYDTADVVFLSEVDCPPRSSMDIVGA